MADRTQLRFQTFRAATLSGAMNAVRRALGDDGLVLETRDCEGGVEILASAGSVSATHDLEVAPLDIPPPRGSAAEARREMLGWHGVSDGFVRTLLEPDLPHALTKAVRFGDVALTRGASPLLLAGEPGAGKTLTTIKLATRLVLAGETPMVICADGRKAGAVEQLASMTQLLGLTLVVADDPAHLRRALARRADEPVLIDGPATIAGDRADGTLLAELAAAAGDAAIALVLPAGLDREEASDAAEWFAAAGARSLLASRLDVARRVGGIVEAAWRSGLSITEGGTGPGAADGLAPLTAAFLASRLLSRGRDLPGRAAGLGAAPHPMFEEPIDAGRYTGFTRGRPA